MLLADKVGGRVRCKHCGSTRIEGIVDAYCVGRVIVGADGWLRVEDGRFEIHQETDISQGSIQCLNCHHNEVRVERAVR